MTLELAIITIHTTINTPIDRVFDLSRGIDLHTTSTHRTGEEAIAGRTTGLIEAGEQVTWRARHWGKIRQHTSLITAMQSPHFFSDQMIKGDFKFFHHQHHFKAENGSTVMTDILEFASPYGWLGKLVDFLLMKRYLTHFLQERNTIIKQYAETDQWKTLLVR